MGVGIAVVAVVFVRVEVGANVARVAIVAVAAGVGLMWLQPINARDSITIKKIAVKTGVVFFDMVFLMQIPGMGLIFSMVVLSAIGDITRFSHPKKLVLRLSEKKSSLMKDLFDRSCQWQTQKNLALHDGDLILFAEIRGRP